jgi:hypothetical protein
MYGRDAEIAAFSAKNLLSAKLLLAIVAKA